MFDNFVVSSEPPSTEETLTVSQDVDTSADNLPEEVLTTDQAVVEPEAVIPVAVEEPIKAPVEQEPSYSKEELDAAVKMAEEKAYEQGRTEAIGEEDKKRDLLLEDISRQLTDIFAGLDKKATEVENSALQFAIELVRKILPTLEKERAEVEVKNFMAQNFANFAGQETLSFAFNPATVTLVADSIGKLAEQNDFEGKIAVHKGDTLGPSDCRIEWKNGGVERNVSETLNKVKELLDNNTQEREHG